MAVLAAGLLIFRSIYLNSVPSSRLPADAAAVLFDTLVRLIRAGLRTLLVAGLVIAIGAFFTGPSVPPSGPARPSPAVRGGWASTAARPR